MMKQPRDKELHGAAATMEPISGMGAVILWFFFGSRLTRPIRDARAAAAFLTPAYMELAHDHRAIAANGF
jgi:hypothetical protein